MLKLKIPEPNWISIASVLVALALFLTYSYVQYAERLFPIATLIVFWTAIFFYISVNLPDEIPKFVKRWNKLKIEKKDLYKRWIFLIALGIFYILVVYGMFLRFGDSGFLVSAIPTLISWIYFFHQDILKDKNKN